MKYEIQERDSKNCHYYVVDLVNRRNLFTTWKRRDVAEDVVAAMELYDRIVKSGIMGQVLDLVELTEVNNPEIED